MSSIKKAAFELLFLCAIWALACRYYFTRTGAGVSISFGFDTVANPRKAVATNRPNMKINIIENVKPSEQKGAFFREAALCVQPEKGQ